MTDAPITPGGGRKNKADQQSRNGVATRNARQKTAQQAKHGFGNPAGIEDQAKKNQHWNAGELD